MLKEEILRHLENDSLYHGSDSLQNLELNAWALLFGLLYEMTEISSLWPQWPPQLGKLRKGAWISRA